MAPAPETPRRRALVVLPADFIGGAERVALGLVRAAVRERRFAQLDIFVLARRPSGSLDEVAALPGVTVTYGRAAREYAAVGAFARFLRGRRYDLVYTTHVHVTALCCVLRRAGLLRARRLVTRESSSIFEVDVGHWGRVVPLLVGLYGAQDEVIHQTAYMRDSFDRHTRGRLAKLGRVVPNPVDVEAVRAAVARPLAGPADPFAAGLNLVWCGRLLPVKRPELMLAVLAALKGSGAVPFRAHVVGDGPLGETLREEAARAGLAADITWWGQMAEPWAVMARCRAGFVTSQVEGFPNVVLEMLAAGVAGVVTTDCAGGLGEIPGVTVVPDAAPAQLAAAMAAALANSAAATPPAGLEACLRERTPAAFLAAIDRDG
jgi:glycosyltransferase involved in cell wall biosynthesis